uniref:partitioning defective 3 homolog isoform X9 n=1 Tax=Styela clava TaxID=7725 RepID=UPI00193A1B65|nr:partitioning defective 3 homolog isoform X9 [Styela clava]
MKNMRVTVCFGQTRVIVPCKGGATVAELVKEACARYKKAIGKTPKYRVKIRQLENAVDGGILDTDDYVFDVAEDRDQLIAIFEEEDNQTYHYNGWDRHSGSGSDGHRSPLSFQHHSSVLNSRFGNDNTSSSRNRPLAPTGNATVIKHNSKREQNLEVNVGVDALKAGPNSHITVRRESEQMLDRNEENIKNIGTHKSPVSKNLNHYYERQVSGGNHLNEENLNPSEYHKQIMITTANSSPDQNVSVVTASSDTNNSIDSGHHSIKTKIMSQDAKNYGNFTRGKMRQSKMGMLSENYDDLPEDKYRYSDIRQPPEGRKEVTSNYADFSSHHKTEYTADRYLPPSPKDSSFYPDFYNDTQEMFVDVDNRPLGVQVMSFMDRNIFCGLLVESVDEGGRSEREELLREGDVIVEINNYVLAQYTLHIAQEIFKNAMKFSELQLRVYPIEERERATLEVPGSTTVEINNALNRHRHTPSIPTLSLVEATPPKASKISAAKSLPDLTASSTSKIPQNVSPVGKIPLAARMSLDTLSNNTRKIGNMLEISLRKGEQGLGFSITTRDTSIGDAGPIYIKNILPKGAAIQDGRLHAGDRLLKVNDIDMTGYTQESAVSILRCIEVGSTVTLLVSRHVNTLPRKMKDDPDADKVLNDDSHREYFKFEIALNDTGSAGLGISLKGNQSKKTKRDLGIFVKSVFHGGAAYQDGRLQPNDQLVSVNGQSLIGMTNHEAIDTLRTSMSTVGNVRGMIQMVIARRKHTNGDPTSPNFSSEASSELSDSIINERTSRLSFEITGSSRDENSVDDSYRYNEEIPEQIDPSPLDGYVNDENRKYSDSMTKNHDDDWMASPDPQDSGIDPFSRESIFRQSISEKRRGGDAANTDTFKALKNKQMNNGLEKKISSSPEPRSPTPKSPSLKWVKPTHTKNHSISSSSTTHSYTPKSPTRRSPRVSKRNLNNSSNLPGSQDAFTEENKRSHTPLSFDYRSTTPSSLSQLSQGSHHYASMTALNYSPLKPLNPSNYPTITETPKSSKNSIGHSYSSDPQSPVPVVRKSNSSDSLMTFGLYTKQPPPSPTYKTTSPNKSGTSRGVPYVKPPVLPYSDLKHLATCCTPVSLGPFTSPSYERPRHPLTARREPTHFEPEVDVGPTLGIAKSSSLESLQTAVENFVENKDAPYPKPQPRVLRGRVLNESFRAALDQSYDMENLSGKPMATRTLREEGTGISPLARTSGSAPTSGQRAHEKKRAGKSYKIFGIFRVGKNKRSQSSDRHLDSFSSNSSSTSSPRLPESEAHKKLLESKREDDFKKHQAENERIQAKAKLMREQQEQRKKDEKNKSREDLANSNHDDRVRAPSVPVTAMQRMNMDPKVTYSESHSGRRSVDPGVMLGSHSQTFEWNSPKRPTSPVDYGDRSRQRRQERNLNVNNIKTTPDYSSLPRQPRLESDAGALPDDPNRIMTHAEENDRMTPTAPHRGSYTQDRSSTGAPGNFNNYEFYNMQKPPSSKRRSAESKFRTNTSEHSSGSVSDRPSRPDKSKVGRTLYYDDTDDSLSRTTVQRSKTPQPQMRLHRDKSPHSQTVRPRTRPVSTINGLGLSPIGNSFHREESPEPPPVMYRSQKAERKAQSSGPYRHSVHVDVPVSRQYERHTTYHSARPRDRKEAPPTSYRWKTDLLTKGQDQSDTDSNRTGSPAHSENAERNRNAMKKMLKARYNEQQDSGKIVISPPYNL